MRTRIKAAWLKAEAGAQVELCGWVKSKRVSKHCGFVMLNDGSTQKDLQVVVDLDSKAFAKMERISTGAALRCQGVWQESPGKGQDFEVLCESMEVLGEAPVTYPLQKKGHSLEFLREIGHIRGRTNTFGAVFRIRNQLSCLVHEFFQSRGFIWAHTPIVTASDCEGAGEMFQVTTLDLQDPPRLDKGGVDFKQDFFGKPAFLTVSGQLNGEALALSMGDIYTFGPTFRAENSNTTRHLAEFWMVEPEMAFADLKDDAKLAESFLRFVFQNILERCPEEFAFLAKFYPECDPSGLLKIAETSFQWLSYTDAMKELTSAGRSFQFAPEWGHDLQTEHEKFLTEEVCKGPVIVTDYPKGIKAFYMRENDDEKTVAAMDVLVPRIGEIIGGSQREDRLDRLEARMKELSLPTEGMSWYLDLRRYGGCPHAGFGLGFERLVQYCTGMANIRDVIPFPRVPQGILF